MTCIVGLVHDGHVYMGGDSVGIDDNHNITDRLDRKFFRSGEFVIGTAGSYRLGQIVQYQFAPPPIEDDLMAYMVRKFVPAIRSVLSLNGCTDEPTILVGIRDRLFVIQPDYQVAEHACGYAAIGMGQEYAYGSLHTSGTQYFTTEVAPAQERIKLALRAAAKFNASVAEPFHYENT